MLNGKVMLITGASRGIGRATALLAADNGAKVVVNYNHSEKEAEEVVSAISEKGYDAIKIKANVADEKEVKEMFNAAREKFGRLDVLVNSAGILKRSLILMTSSKDLQELIDTNIKGVFYCMQQAAKIMIRQKEGKIINVASIVGRYGDSASSVYAATKAAVIAMTTSAAKELGSFGITVNAVAPGFIDTDMTKSIDEKIKQILLNNISLKRPGTPEDVGRVILFLSSGLSDYVSGQVIGVDGCQIM